MKPANNIDIESVFVTGSLVAVAIVVLWQSREFTPFAAIFPRAVGAALLLCSLVALWRILRRKLAAHRPVDRGGLLRSAVLVLTMVIWVAMMESAGFFLTSCVCFLVLALLTSRDRLHVGRLLGFGVAAIACVTLLQLLFQRGLNVRLPPGTWFVGLIG